MTPAAPARMLLIPAKASPYVLVLRRKPSKCFHVMRWNTHKDTIEHGSWFFGQLYPYRCDISFDGQWMVYLALGSKGQTWTAICRLPFLRAITWYENGGTYGGGGIGSSRELCC